MHNQILGSGKYCFKDGTMCCMVPSFDISLFYQSNQSKNNVMKKFIFTANVIAIVALVPAVLFGYLHSNTTDVPAKQSTEVVSDVTNGQDNGSILRIVKSF